MMTPIQKAAYKRYRAECKESNVEPMLKDFLAGDMPDFIANAVWTDDMFKAA